jgi:hypothetical protein
MLVFLNIKFSVLDNGMNKNMYYGGQKISAVIFPSFQKNRCSPFLIVIMIDVFTCHF